MSSGKLRRRGHRSEVEPPVATKQMTTTGAGAGLELEPPTNLSLSIAWLTIGTHPWHRRRKTHKENVWSKPAPSQLEVCHCVSYWGKMGESPPHEFTVIAQETLACVEAGLPLPLLPKTALLRLWEWCDQTTARIGRDGAMELPLLQKLTAARVQRKEAKLDYWDLEKPSTFLSFEELGLNVEDRSSTSFLHFAYTCAKHIKRLAKYSSPDKRTTQFRYAAPALAISLTLALNVTLALAIAIAITLTINRTIAMAIAITLAVGITLAVTHFSFPILSFSLSLS